MEQTYAKRGEYAPRKGGKFSESLRWPNFVRISSEINIDTQLHVKEGINDSLKPLSYLKVQVFHSGGNSFCVSSDMTPC
jgi:hypothetical protein